MKRALALVTLGFWIVACTERRDASSTVARAPASSAPAPAPSLATAPDASTSKYDPTSEAKAFLPITVRSQAAESPAAGWCGETAIQEGLLHLGMWAPQRLINRAGRPTHPDLYATDIPVALDELGVKYTRYAGGRGYEGFARWAREAIDAGEPVIAGVKILPTAHPDWGLDHFVLVVGYGDRGLLTSTTWGNREWVADTTTNGLSLKNAFYGLRLSRLNGAPANARGVGHLTVLDEGSASVKVRLTCPPKSETETKEMTIDPDKIARFHCIAR